MQLVRDGSWRLYVVVAACSMLISASLMVGCGGAASDVAPIEDSAGEHQPSAVMQPAAVAEDWADMIEEAGLDEYAELGRRMLHQGRVRFVEPPELEQHFNAFAWINRREIWINEPMFERYPDVLDQATIFLHELIHIKSGECTHNGPWWSAQSEFYGYFTDQETSAMTVMAHDASIGVAPSGDASLMR